MAKENLVCEVSAVHSDTVEAVRAKMPPSAEMQDLAALYSVFADYTRVRILWALTQERMCVCDLAALLGMTESAISHQLKLLRISHLVSFEKEGKIVFYSLADEHIRDIFEKGFEHIHE